MGKNYHKYRRGEKPRKHTEAIEFTIPETLKPTSAIFTPAITEPVDIPDVTCPHCRANFSPLNIKGDVGSRTCPECGGEISERVFDELALQLTNQRNAASRALKKLNEPVRSLSKKIKHAKKWWQKPQRWYYQLRLNQLTRSQNPQRATLKRDIKEAKKDLKPLAHSRYYTSEWFLATHFSFVNEAPYMLYVRQFIPRYTYSGTFELVDTANSTTGSGFLGEYRLFNLLLARTLDSTSPLFGARILPNLYLPAPPRKNNPRSALTQIDMILLTRSHAYVIETKRWLGRIYVDTKTGDVYRRSSRKLSSEKVVVKGVTYQKTHANLSQNFFHKCMFLDECHTYPRDEVFPVTMFLDATSLESHRESYRGNLFGLIGSDSDPITQIENIERDSVPLISQEELIETADNLMNAYNDKDHSKEAAHSAMLTA